jgi:hypothetical protein
VPPHEMSDLKRSAKMKSIKYIFGAIVPLFMCSCQSPEKKTDDQKYYDRQAEIEKVYEQTHGLPFTPRAMISTPDWKRQPPY